MIYDSQLTTRDFIMHYKIKFSTFPVITIAICFLSIPQLLFCQQRGDCGTRAPATPIIISMDEEQMKRSVVAYMLKIVVHNIADDNGNNAASGDSSILRQLENLQAFFAPHSICFQLIGMDTINDSDLNIHNTDTEEMDLFPHLIDDAITIFVHWELFNNEEGLNGMAYGIPNTYPPISRGAITCIGNLSTLSHEMGHCLGLYHTFETFLGEEEVPRSGDCKNCGQAGDLLCDTEADPHSDIYDTGNFINTSCTYFGTIERECEDESYPYQMDPHNIMAYGRRAC